MVPQEGHVVHGGTGSLRLRSSAGPCPCRNPQSKRKRRRLSASTTGTCDAGGSATKSLAFAGYLTGGAASLPQEGPDGGGGASPGALSIFSCAGLAWCQFGEEAAESELIRALGSSDRKLRVLARPLLSNAGARSTSFLRRGGGAESRLGGGSRRLRLLVFLRCVRSRGRCDRRGR